MCGFVGFSSAVDFDRFQADLDRAIDSIGHRGPDDSGVFIDDQQGVGLGHRRLSVIDLSPAGHQPMISDDGKSVIVFNGEVYNYSEIKNELTGFGHQFEGASDTEVVLKAYIQWGVECLEKFIGMFAFAIWDKTSKKFFIARDRLGIKPIYYYFEGKTLIFGSELKALMAFSRFPRDVDPDAFHLYLHYQYVPAPRTIFKNTFKLEPGHFLIFDGKDLTKKRWWRLPGNDMETSA